MEKESSYLSLYKKNNIFLLRMMRIIGIDQELEAYSANIAVARFFWITYRHDFVPIPETAFTSDAGWGCMIRCGQMLAATAILSTILGESIISAFSLILDWLQLEQDEGLRGFIAAMFLDLPTAPLAIHNIAAKGATMGKRIGEWHAPSVTSRCLRFIVS
jgi:hypothetical protein